MFSVIYAECRFCLVSQISPLRYAFHAKCRCAECHYAECHYAECRYAESRGASGSALQVVGT
jgi:hypothetical protein